MAFSIVIATFNRKNVLQKLLRRLEKQSDMDFEVVVAVDGSTDGTQEWLEKYKKKAPFELRWVDTGLTERYGLAIARNMGIKEAKDGPVVIIDDDSLPEKDFVKEHKRTVRSKTLTGGMRLDTDPESSLKSKMQEYLDVYGDSTPRDFVDFTRHKNPYVVENNTCMYKEDWIDAGLFDESVNGYGQIAQGFVGRLKELGFKYQFNPRAAILHKTEYKRPYGSRKREIRKTPMWLRRALYPFKQWLKSRFPRVYQKAKSTSYSLSARPLPRNRQHLVEKVLNTQKRSHLFYRDYTGPGFLQRLVRVLIAPRVYVKKVQTRIGYKEVGARLAWGRTITIPVQDKNIRDIKNFGILAAENPLTCFLIKHLRKGDVFYDIGASYGFFTFLAQEFIAGEIHAFEPIPEVFYYLAQNVDGNNRIHCNQFALSETNGETVFYVPAGLKHTGAATLVKPVTSFFGYKSKEVQVSTRQLDTYVKTHAAPTVIKVDVEGAEKLVFEGGKELLTEKSPLIIMEVWGQWRGSEYSDRAAALLQELGYYPYRLTSTGDAHPVDVHADKNISRLVTGGHENFVFAKSHARLMSRWPRWKSASV